MFYPSVAYSIPTRIAAPGWDRRHFFIPTSVEVVSGNIMMSRQLKSFPYHHHTFVRTMEDNPKPTFPSRRSLLRYLRNNWLLHPRSTVEERSKTERHRDRTTMSASGPGSSQILRSAFSWTLPRVSTMWCLVIVLVMAQVRKEL